MVILDYPTGQQSADEATTFPTASAKVPIGRLAVRRKALAYVAGPYRSDNGEFGVSLNIHNAGMVASELWKMGFAVICPHKNTSFFGGVVPDTDFLDGDKVMVAKCDLLVAIEGWSTSKGAQGEIKHALENGVPVYYWSWREGSMHKLYEIGMNGIYT